MENYKYTLTYQNNDNTLTSTFNAEVTMEELKEQLKYFLRGCSWTDSSLVFLEEDPVEETTSIIKAEYYDKIWEFVDKAIKEEWKADKIIQELKDEFL